MIKSVPNLRKLYASVLCFPLFGFAQTTIHGIITQKEKPLSGVVVEIDGSYDGTRTNQKGEYSFSTDVKGEQMLSFLIQNQNVAKRKVVLSSPNKDVLLNLSLVKTSGELEQVTIVSHKQTLEKKSAIANFSKMDMVTAASSNPGVRSLVEVLPGVQTTPGETGLSLRGGRVEETAYFLDGNPILNYYSPVLAGFAGSEQINRNLLQSITPLVGGYSAKYGQALSGILQMESITMPEKTTYGLGVSPIFVHAATQQLSKNKMQSYGVDGSYSNLWAMNQLFPFEKKMSKIPFSYAVNANFRAKTKAGGFFSYYGQIQKNGAALQEQSDEGTLEKSIKGTNAFQSMTFRQKFGAVELHLGSSMGLSRSLLQQISFTKTSQINTEMKYATFQSSLNYAIASHYLQLGMSWQSQDFARDLSLFENATQLSLQTKNNTDNPSFFVQDSWRIYKPLLLYVGLRSQRMLPEGKTEFSPRVSLRYDLFKDATLSGSYGDFYQNPNIEYGYQAWQQQYMEKATHAIVQLQIKQEKRDLDASVYYKRYQDLTQTKFNGIFYQAIAKQGEGSAKGVDVFWRDKKTFSSFEYWLSYSYLDTKRNDQNYSQSLTPSYASKNTFSLVGKKFITAIKTGISLSWSYKSPRNYYNIDSQNNLLESGKLPAYQSTNVSFYCLPNLGKVSAKSSTVVFLGVDNLFGNKIITGYDFQEQPKQAIYPMMGRSVFVGVFFSFGKDRSEDIVNQRL